MAIDHARQISCRLYASVLFAVSLLLPPPVMAGISDQDAGATALPQQIPLQIAPAENSGNCNDQFTVIIQQPIDSKTSHNGDPLYAKLGSPLDINGLHFAPGSMVVGRITEVDKARRHIVAEVTPKRWLHADGGLGFEIDEVLDADGHHADICGTPVAMTGAFRKAVDEKSLAVTKTGVLTPSRKSELAPKSTRTAIGVTATITHSPFVPLAGGIIGALAPSLVLESCDKEYQSQVKHRRLKGFATGAIAGMPGGFLVNDTFMKGREQVLKPGTVILMRLHELPSGTG